MRNDTLFLVVDILGHPAAGTSRLIRLGAWVSDTSLVTLWAEISTSAGVLAGFHMVCDTTQDVWLSILEYTDSDSLDIFYNAESGSVTETYNLNGDTDTLTYSDLDQETKRSLVEHMLENYPDEPEYGRYLPGEAEYLAEIYSFHGWYDDTTTLHDNSAAELLAELFGDSNFNDWLMAEYSTSSQRAGTWDKICAIAGTIAIVKCSIGGVANGLCDIAGIITVLCLIREFFAWLS